MATLTYDEINEVMKISDSFERLRVLMVWLEERDCDSLPDSLEGWKDAIEDYHKAQHIPWAEDFAIPWPSVTNIRLVPPPNPDPLLAKGPRFFMCGDDRRCIQRFRPDWMKPKKTISVPVPNSNDFIDFVEYEIDSDEESTASSTSI